MQILAGYLKLAKLMSFVSQSVVTGFVNALAILIFMAQLPELTGVTWHVYAMTALGLGIIYLFPLIPKLGKTIPSPLVCIVALTALSTYLGLDIRTVGDMGKLPDSLPIFLIPEIPLTFETLSIIFPYAVGLTVVGLLESLMTATIVNDLTDTTSGGRGRLSTLLAGVFLLIMVVFLSKYLVMIPMAALVAVMIMVATVVVVVFTHNLAYGVLVGVLLAALFFANKISRLMYVDTAFDEESGTKVYKVHGQIFFNSSDRFIEMFDFKEAIDRVTIDLNTAHFWDVSAVAALDKVVIKFRREGTDVEIKGLNKASQTIIDKFGVYDNPDEIEKILGGH